MVFSTRCLRKACALYGGGGELERVSFLAKNSDCSGDSALTTTQGSSLEAPCKTRDTARRRRCFFSKAPFLAQKSFRERLQVESIFQQSHDSTSTILESKRNSERQKPSCHDTPLESTPICIDGGAHAGLVSDIILYCGGVVHSFEPNALLHTILESKYHANPNVILHHAALSHEAGEVRFYVYDDISQGNRIQGASDPSHTQSAAKQYKVPAIDLCAYVQKLLQEHERLYFVKLDIEGAEFDIMDRLLDMKLYEKIDYIACETHERFFHDGKARIARLREKITKHGATNILLDWI